MESEGAVAPAAQQLPGSGADTPVVIDIWIGKDDFLPYKLAMTASANTAAGHMELTGEGTFDGYNQPVSIPDLADAGNTIETYVSEYLPRAAAEVLLRRGGESIPPRKRRVLRRCARIQRSPAGWAWLAWMMGRSRVTGSKTMGAERFLLAYFGLGPLTP